MKYCPECRAELEVAEVDGVQRRRCTAEGCDFVFWDNPTPVVAVLVECDGKVILAHNRSWPEGMYSIITGFLEKGETPEEAALREAKEELGLEADDPELIGVYAFPQMNQVIIAYHVQAQGEVRLSQELSAYKLIPKEKLKGWGFGAGLAVADWVERVRRG